MVFIRQCDYCKKTIEPENGYYYITSKPKERESHMCHRCFGTKAGIGRLEKTDDMTTTNRRCREINAGIERPEKVDDITTTIHDNADSIINIIEQELVREITDEESKMSKDTPSRMIKWRSKGYVDGLQTALDLFHQQTR